MGELGQSGTHATRPQLPRVTALNTLRLLADQRQQTLLKHLGPRRTQRQQPDRSTELIGHPAIEIALDHVQIRDPELPRRCGPGRWPAQTNRFRQGVPHVVEQLQQRLAHLTLLGAHLSRFTGGQQPAIEIKQPLPGR